MFFDAPPGAQVMLTRKGNFMQSGRAMSGIGIYEKNSLQRTATGKAGAAPVPDPDRQAQIDRTARVLRILALNARTANLPDPRDVRGILCDTYG